MKAEKIIISFIAVLIGIIVAGLSFYFYQSTKVISTTETKTITIVPPTPTPQSAIFLSVDTPKDEEVVSNKTISISGKTIPNATVIITTSITDQVITPAINGNFSTSLVLDDDQNEIEITAIAPTGLEEKITRTVTYSTESF